MMKHRFNLNDEDIQVIMSYIKQEYKSEEKIPAELENICKKFEVSTFEEVVRILVFNKIIDAKLSKDYFGHVEKTILKQIKYTLYLRQILLDYTFRMPEQLYAFYDNYCAMAFNKDFDKIKSEVTKIKTNKEISSYFKIFESIISLTKKHFDSIFYAIFQIENTIYEYADDIENYFKTPSAKYLFILFSVIDQYIGLGLKRRLTSKEKSILKYLVYEGDSINYIEENRISAERFKKIISDIEDIYDVDSINQLLIAYLVFKETEY